MAAVALLAAGFGTGRTTAIPIGDEIVYARDGQLYGLSLSTNQERQISHFSTGYGASDPAWTPDGARIVFSLVQPPQRGVVSGSDLYQIDRNGDNLTLVFQHTERGEQLQSPVFRPDDGVLYFSRFIPDLDTNEPGHDRMEIVRLVAGQPEVVATDGLMMSFSADGRRLAYVGVAPLSGSQSLRILDLNTGSAKTLIPEDAYANIFWPRFSPDGSELAFGGAPVIQLRAPGLALAVPRTGFQPFAHGEPSDLYLIDAESGKTSLVATLAENDPAAIWSTDGARLWVVGLKAVYTANRDGSGFGFAKQPGGIGATVWRGK
jgi:Tol biopolymer transport system component